MYRILSLLCITILAQACTIEVQETRAFWPVKVANLAEHPPVKELFIPHNDSTTINAVHYDHPESKDIILFLHGNSKNIWSRFNRIDYADSLGIDFMMIDYAGFGKNKGTPSFQGLYDYAYTAYRYLLKSYPATNIIVMGNSIGSLPAAKIASEQPIKKLILEAAITSLEDIEDNVMSYIPVINWFINFEIDPKIKFNQYEVVKNIKVPTLFIHSEVDKLSPFENVKELYHATGSKRKYFYPIKDAPHNRPFLHTEEYLKELADFLGS